MRQSPLRALGPLGLEDAAEESLLPFRSWLSLFPQAYKALELLHYLYKVEASLVSVERAMMEQHTSSSLSFRSCSSRCFRTAVFSLANLEISARSRSYTNRESISRGNYRQTSMSESEQIKVKQCRQTW